MYYIPPAPQRSMVDLSCPATTTRTFRSLVATPSARHPLTVALLWSRKAAEKRALAVLLSLLLVASSVTLSAV